MIDLNNSTVRIYTNLNKAGEVINKAATLTYPWFNLFWIIPIKNTVQLKIRRSQETGLSEPISCHVTEQTKHSIIRFYIHASITDKEYYMQPKMKLLTSTLLKRKIPPPDKK